ncbi:MAG: NADP-dependent phosphogluconate dehydrogenase [bacterium]|nr:NADP-dependent phosphogluconate dehydrogenase [bacterium]
MAAAKIGLIGLAVMGANLARNISHKGHTTVVYNRTAEKMAEFIEQFGSDALTGEETLAGFVQQLEKPRKIIIMVKAGDPVDEVLAQLLPLLDTGDIIIDCGNSHYRDTMRREKQLKSKGIHIVGCGVSGGEEGALKGPSLMPGGSDESWNQLKAVWESIAAKDFDGKPCVTHVGADGAGHFVKMVHNGIEYADMQLIAEAYHLLTYVTGLNNEQLAETFHQWNAADDLRSFLIEITAKIVEKKDELTGGYLLDVVKDSAQQKGTGGWTVEAAMDYTTPVPSIAAAVDARLLSSQKNQRVSAAKKMDGVKVEMPVITAQEVRAALLLSKICVYAQGMALIQQASEVNGWNLNLSEICRIWQGGCIIRSALLKSFSEVFLKNPNIANLMVAEELHLHFRKNRSVWAAVVSKGIQAGVPLPALSASLAYFDSYFTERLPQNLTQAQRDFFGAHTYERLDREGAFHSNWNQE